MSRSYLTALGRENAKEFYEDNRVIDVFSVVNTKRLKPP